MACRYAKRLDKELRTLQLNAVQMGIEVADVSKPNEWQLVLLGAAGTIYEGERYPIRFRFPARYPLESPEVVFVANAQSKPPEHPHVYSNGHICLSILYDAWSPALTVQSICLSLLSMLSSCQRKKKPSDDDFYVATVGNQSPKLSKWHYDDDTV